MKKSLFLIVLLALMGGAMAQNQGTREYVSALITFHEGSNVPQDSLDAYGVIIQTRSGRMANALIDASHYHAFLLSNLVERVQPSTRVYLRDEQVYANGNQRVSPRRPRNYVKDDENPDRREDVRYHMIPEKDIRNDEAKGWYLGLLLGGSSNKMEVNTSRWEGNWYTYRGLNFEARAGYQCCEHFGIRSGLDLVSKNYVTDLVVPVSTDKSETLRTFHENMYLQLPLMADLSVGSNDVRLHLMLGGYAAFWATQCRTGYVYVPSDPRPYSGTSYKFVEGLDYRFDAGLAGGLGLTLSVAPNWQLHFEGNYYHGLLSVMEKPYKAFNRTTTFGMGVTYHF